MSLKKNTLANYAGQIYTTLIGIVMLPFYLEFLGAEAYGLVGFFTLLQSWLALLGAGLAPTLARQMAYYHGLEASAWQPFRALLRSLELIILTIAIASGLLVWLGSDWLASSWLDTKTLPIQEVAYCITLMGVMVGLRWGVSLYASGIGGLEKQVWLNGFNTLIATLRYGAAYILLRWVTQDVNHFFEFQLLVSLLELLFIARKFYTLQPAESQEYDPGLKLSIQALKPTLPFILGTAYTSLLWVFMTQTDKLVLSHVLPLDEYGYFALVALIANGILRFAEPVNQAILPRMTRLFAQDNPSNMLEIYRGATQFLAVFVYSLAGIMAVYAEPLLYGLTGNAAASAWGAPVLLWFALGNGILVLVGMQYNMQYVHGQLRMHVINTTINAAIQVPILAFVAYRYGAVPAAQAWFIIRLVNFFIWPALVHRKFVPGLHSTWLIKDILSPLLGAALGLAALATLTGDLSPPPHDASRWALLAQLGLMGIFVLTCSALTADKVRQKALRLVLQTASPKLTAVHKHGK